MRKRHLAAAVAHIGIAVVDAAIGEPLHRPAPGVAVEGVGAGGKIGAGAEPAPGAGDDDGADVVVLVGLVEGVDQFLLHRGVEGVELVGPVQGDGQDLLGDLIFDRLIRHRGFLCGVVVLILPSFRACARHDPSLLSKTMDAGSSPAHDARNARMRYYFFGGFGQGFCGPRIVSNAFAMPSTPRSSKRRPIICTPIGNPLDIIAAVDRDRRILRHVPGHGVADVLERPVGIVDRGGELGGKIHHRRHRRNHIVDDRRTASPPRRGSPWWR